MKKLSMYLLATFMVLVAFGLQNLVGQGTQTVSINSVYNYQVVKNVSGSSVAFVLTGAGVTAADYTVVSTTNNLGDYTQNIRWESTAAGKVVTISATETNGSCAGSTTTMVVTVDASPVAVQFAAGSTAAACELTSDFTTNVTFSRTMAVSEFPMTLSIDVVVDGATVATHTATVTNPTPLVASATGILTLPNATFLFNGNSTVTAQTQSITINATGSVDNHSGSIGRGATFTHTKVVNPIPVTNAITVF